MVPAALRRLGTLGLIALWVLVSGGLLLLLALSVQNSVQYSKLQAWILLVNAIAVVTVSVLLARKIIELVRAFRAQVPGSRLTARTVAIFGSLVIAPLIIVYLFSLEFLNRGIDSWFKVEIKQGLTDALELSKSAMDVRMREYARSTELFANRLADSPTADWALATDAQRVDSGALEVVVYGALGQVLAASSAGATATNLPQYATPEMTRSIAGGNTYWSLEPLSEGDYLINTAAPIAAAPGSSEGRFVVALYPVPPQLARLSEAVQRSYSQHGELSAQREPVKNSFRMTLTLVLLLAMLTAIYGAIYSAEKLTRPVQDLIAGTRAVGKGDFGTRLPLPSRDEMGFLVHSFNDMTKRLRRAREETTRSQQAVERERERLSIILARLTTGVIAIGRDLVLRSANHAASSILGVDLEQGIGQPLERAHGRDNPRYARFVGEVSARLAKGEEEWREQMDLKPEMSGARVLVCACTPLPGNEHAEDDAERQGGYVIVFDDISALLQAQRDAAWGEVARRLAHEIKNPLTPIQLSAERMRRRYLDTDEGRGRADARSRHLHHRAAGRGHEGHGERLQRIRARAGHEGHAFPAERAGDRSRRPAPRAGIRACRSISSWIRTSSRSRPTAAACARSSTISSSTAVEAVENIRPPATWSVATKLEMAGGAAYATITVSDNGPGFRARSARARLRPLRHQQAQGHRIGARDRKKDRRGARRARRSRQSARRRRARACILARNRRNPTDGRARTAR